MASGKRFLLLCGKRFWIRNTFPSSKNSESNQTAIASYHIIRRYIFSDCNHNGTIEKKDFDLALDRVGQLRKFPAGSPKLQEVQDNLGYVWEHLKKVADRDNDGTVSEQEWLKMWEEAVSANQDPAWVKRYQNFLFEVEDVSGDGKVDENEYVAAYKQYGIAADESKTAFKKLINVSLRARLLKRKLVQMKWMWLQFFRN